MTRSSSISTTGRAAFFGLAAFALFSTHDIIVKHLGATYSPFQILFFSALLSFPLLTIYMITDEKPATLRPAHPGWLALRSVSGAVSATCAFYAFSKLPLSQVYVFIFAAPLLITVLAVPMLGETIRLRRGLAVCVGLFGVLIVLQPGNASLGAGHISALVAALAAALNAIVVRKIGADERGVVMVLYPMIANLLLSAAALPFVYVEIRLDDLGLLALASALVLVAMACLVAAYTHGKAITVAPLQYSQIIWATMFGIVFFGEYPHWTTYLGAAVIVISGLYILRREASDDVSENRPVLMTKTRMGHSVGLRVDTMLRRRLRNADNKEPISTDETKPIDHVKAQQSRD